MGKLCNFALLAFATAAFAAPPNSSVNLEPTCFTAPDQGHDVSKAIGTCNKLFDDFLGKFDPNENSTFLWTSDNTKWKDPDVVHLPWLDSRIDTNQTHACLLDIIDLTASGDRYAPTNVVKNGLNILDRCFKQDLCGEIVLGPDYTTRLTVCASIHDDSNAVWNSRLMQGSVGCPAATDAAPQKCESSAYQSVQTAGRIRRSAH